MKKTISMLLLVCIVLSVFAMTVSAVDVIDYVKLETSNKAVVGNPIIEFQYDVAAASACHIGGANTQYLDSNGNWQTTGPLGDKLFEYNVEYRFELWLYPNNEHLCFDSANLPTIDVPTGTTITIEDIAKDGSLHCYFHIGKPKVVPPSMFFNDVHTSDWFYHDVEYVYYNLMMNGVGNGNFDPSGTCTRAMVVTVLYRLMGEPSIGAVLCPFKDVPEGEWYTNAVKWAEINGVVNGMSATTFEPNTPVSREQLATIICRFAKECLHEPVSDGIMLAGFTDSNQISAWASDALSWAFAHGIVGGTDTATGKYLYPQNNASRCEVAAILHRFCAEYMDK